MIKSPLRYPGGKSKALRQITPLIPDFEEYREPFVGGGSVFAHTRQTCQNRIFWINDLHTNLYQFWKAVGEHPDHLVQQVKEWKKSFSDGKLLYRFLLDNMSDFPAVKQGAAFFVLNRLTFSGTTESGGYSRQAYEKRFTDSSIERLIRFVPLLEEVKVTNLDYEHLVLSPGKKVFLFLDPPYYSATNSALYGKKGNLHKQFDHERFAKVLKNCPHQWLITYDDSNYIRDLFSFARIRSWHLTYGMRNVGNTSNQRAREIFISNYSF